MNKRLTKLNKLQFTRYIILAAVITIGFSHSALSVEYEYQWGQVGEIDVDLYGPEDGTYVPINTSKYLGALASDEDCYRYREVGTSQWSEWYTYWDVVQYGNTSSDYHMWWEAEDGEFEDMYGSQALWTAPDYSGSGIRNVTVTVHADDFNRGTDTFGYNDGSRSDSINLKVWEVEVSARQSGTKSSNNDVTDDPSYGDPNLGWIVPDPTGPEDGYYGNTELKGSIPEGVPYIPYYSYDWYNGMKGIKRHKDVASSPDWVTPYDYNETTYEYDSWESASCDGDPKSPDDVGSYVREIFAMDSPGIFAGTTNDNAIAAPYNYRAINFDMDYQTYVKYGGIRVSNYCEWEVELNIVESSGKWSVSGSHTP